MRERARERDNPPASPQTEPPVASVSVPRSRNPCLTLQPVSSSRVGSSSEPPPPLPCRPLLGRGGCASGLTCPRARALANGVAEARSPPSLGAGEERRCPRNAWCRAMGALNDAPSRSSGNGAPTPALQFAHAGFVAQPATGPTTTERAVHQEASYAQQLAARPTTTGPAR